ncbi:MAG: conjugal transfer protein TraF [Deltaproteobacteria bacterium]|nr:conjugal transfer protein TraF [Deltaproteobacteria bacterium]
MQHYKRILSAALVSVFSASANAGFFSVEARSLGMGNARVATADIATAPFANPGMLAFQPSREDFSLLLGAGAYLMDADGLVDKIDEYQTAYNNFTADPVGNISEGVRAVEIAQSMDGDILAPEAAVLLSTGFSADKWAFAVSARADAIAAGTVTDIAQDPIELVDPTKNILQLEGVLTSELGVSVARNFRLFGQKMAVGVKPKYVKVDNIHLSESLSTVDTGLGDLIDNSTNDLGDYTTLDLGLVMGLTEHTQIGLVGTNLVSHTVNFINSRGNPETISFDTQWRLGLAFRNNFLTLGADMDLLENDALLTTQNFQALKTQFVSVGGEFNLKFMQLRVGAQKNIADGISDGAKETMYTAGLGLWFGFNLDAAVVAQSNSLGGFLQAGFRF